MMGMGLLFASLAGLQPRLVEAGDAELAERLAMCAVYYFTAANAGTVSGYESAYRKGEQAFNGALEEVGEQQALRLFNRASEEVGALMQRRWAQFDKVESLHGGRCEALLRDRAPQSR